ncbi:sensor histidine kinase [Spirosoma rigui]|uniref:sensor histidine kinase n=1 Tax=Spirosoma rigui TaxID=564064 RepID=UPI0009B02C1B|nr:ATP-binding protein [Spirosoma rigui]
MNANTAERWQVPGSLWQTALDQSSSGIVVYKAVRSADGSIDTFQIQLANYRAEQLIGLTRSEMLGKRVDDVFASSARMKLWTDLAEAIDTAQVHHSELFHRITRTGLDYWFDLTIQPLDDGEQAVVSFTDITELKTAQQLLLGESILFKTLSSTVPGMCVVVVNYFQKVLFANGKLPGLFNSANPDDVLSRRIVDTMRPDYQPDWKRYISSALMGEQHSFSDHWGGWRCECYVGPVRNERGDIVMAICVYRDITEQFRQQQALQRMNSDLQRSNNSLEQFAYVASHDLQEPLRKIRSFGDLLRDRYAEDLGGAGADMVQRMQSAADRMDLLIKSLLSYARITAPTAIANRQKQDLVSIEAVLGDILTDLEMTISERGAVIKHGPHLPMVPGDATQLRQLFQNLMTNAMKFTRPDQRPEVTVTGELVRGYDVPDFPGIDPLLEYAHFRVQDNGIGIDTAHFDTIFGLFNRLHGRQQFAGTGIGLATCRRVAENHGGTIRVESTLNYGTTFHVYLPLHIPEQAVD